jgi:flagellar motor protein MotB
MGKKFQNEVENFYVSFSDLLSLLLIFFVYLFSMSTIDPVKFTESSASITEEFAEKKTPATSAAFGKASPDKSDPAKAEPRPEAAPAEGAKKTIGQTVDDLIAKVVSKENTEKDAKGEPKRAGKTQAAGDTSGEQRAKMESENKQKDAAGDPATSGKSQSVGQNDAAKFSKEQREAIAGGGEAVNAGKTQTIGQSIGQTVDKLVAKVFSKDNVQKSAAGEPSPAGKSQTDGSTSGDQDAKLNAEKKEKKAAGDPATSAKSQTIGQSIGQTIDKLVAKVYSKDSVEKSAAGEPAPAGKTQPDGSTSGDQHAKLIAEKKEKEAAGDTSTSGKSQSVGQNDAAKFSKVERAAIAGGGEPEAAGKSQTIGQTIDKLVAKVFSKDSVGNGSAGESATAGKPKSTDVSPTSDAPEDRSAQGMLAEKLAHYIEKEKLEGQVSVHVDARGVKVVLESPVLFESGSAELSSEGKRILMKLGPVFKEVTNPVVIEGHTDNIPVHNSIYGTNWELSFQRTLSVMKFFVGQFKFTPNQLSGTGYGEYRPLVPNNSDANRAKNRRIEISILRDYETTGASTGGVALTSKATNK